MTDNQNQFFTDEELNQQARTNASALAYLLAAFAKACGRLPDEAAVFTGRAFAPGWEEVRGQGALVAARLMALNMASLGAEVRSLTGDDGQAEVRMTGYPTEAEVTFFGVSRDEADRFMGVSGPIAESLGLRAIWQRTGEEIVLTVVRNADDGT